MSDETKSKPVCDPLNNPQTPCCNTLLTVKNSWSGYIFLTTVGTFALTGAVTLIKCGMKLWSKNN